MPDARPLGNTAKRTLLELLDAHDANADLIAEAMADLLDGDDDTTTAQSNLILLMRNNGREAGALGHLERGDMQRAEDAASTLARDAKKRPASTGK